MERHPPQGDSPAGGHGPSDREASVREREYRAQGRQPLPPDDDMLPHRLPARREARTSMPPSAGSPENPQRRETDVENAASATRRPQKGSGSALQERPFREPHEVETAAVTASVIDQYVRLAQNQPAEQQGWLPDRRPAENGAGATAGRDRANASKVAPRLLEGEPAERRSRTADSRWFALGGVFAATHEAALDGAGDHPQAEPLQVPLLTVFSHPGGAGRTTLVATLGRALAAAGEKVLLAEIAAHGLLPFHFGASEGMPGSVRTFSPPAGSPDAPIQAVKCELWERAGEGAEGDRLEAELRAAGRGLARLLVDLGPESSWFLRRLVRMGSRVLVPLRPDLNSVLSLGPLERLFASVAEEAGRPVEPMYLLNMFDPALPLHLDIRLALRRELGERLLPLEIRSSPAVPEALAEGMTVLDYAPETAAAQSFQSLAAWVGTRWAGAAAGGGAGRWSEA